MPAGLLISRKNKLSLLKTSLTDPSMENISKYKNYRNAFNKILRASKTAHYNQQLKQNAKNPKKLWETLKEVTTGTKSNTKIEKIVVNNATICETQTMANEFNKFFANAGKNIANSINPTTNDPMDYMPNVNCDPLEFTPMTQSKLIQIVENMAPKNSNDINGINTKMIKFLIFEIDKPLLHLFNLSISTAKFPTKLKTSRTVPIFKTGDPNSCDNYRPISLLSAISKILEKYIANSLVDHLEHNKLLYEHQYGFQKGKSTVHNLLHLTNFVAKELNKKNFVVGIFLDLKKAFDVVPHDLLIKKLKRFGISEMALKWFISYLDGRTQKVEIDGLLSDELPILISVLQGSILGPILFLCYINDIYLTTDLFTLLFADDTAGLMADNNIHNLIQKVNIEVKKLANWFRANRMAVNVSKTKYIIFKPKGMTIKLDDNEGINFDDNDTGLPFDPTKITRLDRIHSDSDIASNRTYKLLGLHLDEHLSFDYHCSTISSKIAQSNFIINRAKNFLPLSALKTLYFALVHPHLLYCLPIYGCTSAKNISKIEKAQKKSIRIISKAKSISHTAPLFEALRIMPFKTLLTYTQSLLIHSIYHKYCPHSLHDIWTTNNNRQDADNDHDLRNGQDLYIELAKTEQTKRLPYFALPKIWNEMHVQKYTTNPITFKIAIKSHFLDQINPA